MGRPNRISFPGMFAHIIVRGINGKKIFREEEDYRFLLTLCRKLKVDFRFKMFTFCLMPNHFHLFIQICLSEDSKSISIIMQKLNLNYSKYYNRKYNRSGPLFNNRFKSIIVQSGKYASNLMRYIDLNPCSLSEKYRRNPFSYKWSGIEWTAKGKGPYKGLLDTIPWLKNDNEIDLFRRSYRFFLQERIFLLNEIGANILLNARIIGNKRFIRSIILNHQQYWLPIRKNLPLFVESAKKTMIFGLAFKFV